MKVSSPYNRAAIAALIHRGQWHQAIELAASPYKETDGSYFCHSALMRSRCHLALGENQPALFWAQCVIQAQPVDSATELAQWLYAHLLAARACLAQLGTGAAIDLLTAAHKRCPSNPQINKYLANSLISQYGDWSAAEKLLGQANAAVTLPREYTSFNIQSQIYNGTAKPETLTHAIIGYSQQYLQPRSVTQPKPASGQQPAARKRLGLASPLLSASPVYFLCIGALRHLARDFDLVFFHTGKVQDWATAEFRSLASDWHEVSGLTSAALASLMRHSQLQVLLDMAGWLDQTLLQALAQCPAQQQYKWVGGQSATTGLRGYSGFITDCHQSPPDTATLYSEPLALMPDGYVTYTAPPYMPDVRCVTESSSTPFTAGIVAHPKKLSAVFMRYLRGQIRTYALASKQPVNLCFVGSRYADTLLQQRINQLLGLDAQAQRGPVNVIYRAGHGHLQQLELVAALDWVVDTFPYSAGVTALEALALGVPIRTHAGSHFSERHGYSHARFAGMQHEDTLLVRMGALGSVTHRHQGRTLLHSDCARLNHLALAQSLSQLFGCRNASSAAGRSDL